MTQRSKGYGRHHGLRLVCNHRFSSNTLLTLSWNNKGKLSPSGVHGFFQVSVLSINVRQSFRRDFLIYAMKSYKPRSCVYVQYWHRGACTFLSFQVTLTEARSRTQPSCFFVRKSIFLFRCVLFFRLYKAYAFKILNSFGWSIRTQWKHLLFPLGEFGQQWSVCC